MEPEGVQLYIERFHLFIAKIDKQKGKIRKMRIFPTLINYIDVISSLFCTVNVYFLFLRSERF